MDMSRYVEEIKHAAGTIFPVVWAEQKRLIELDNEIRRLDRIISHNAYQAQAWQDSDDPEDVAFGGGIYWSTYFNEDKERYHKDAERQQLDEAYKVRAFSVSALAGDLLQYGKQGISIVFGGPDKCKDGRLIGEQRLPDVIWNGRNHALHWEDPKPHAKTVACFEKLTEKVCKKFDAFKTRNQAFHLIYHLGWTDFDKFAADLRSLE